MRKLFCHIRQLIETRYGATEGRSAELPWQGVSSFLFLRFFVPAILHPHLFGMWPGRYTILHDGLSNSSSRRADGRPSPTDVNADCESNPEPREPQYSMYKPPYMRVFLMVTAYRLYKRTSICVLSKTSSRTAARL